MQGISPVRLSLSARRQAPRLVTLRDVYDCLWHCRTSPSSCPPPDLQPPNPRIRSLFFPGREEVQFVLLTPSPAVREDQEREERGGKESWDREEAIQRLLHLGHPRPQALYLAFGLPQ